MKRFLYAIGALNVLWILAGLGGVVLDPGRLDFWTWNLMAALLATVVLAPLLVFAGTRPERQTPVSAPQTEASTPSFPPETSSPSQATTGSRTAPAHVRPSSPPRSRSAARALVYTGSVLLLLWLFTSLFGLFLNPANLGFWTQSVMWTLIAAVVFAPILVFAVNPFEDPARSDTGTPVSTTGLAAAGPARDEPEPFVPEPPVPATSHVSEPATTVPDSSAPLSPSTPRKERPEERSSPEASDASAPQANVPPLPVNRQSDPDPDWNPWPSED